MAIYGISMQHGLEQMHFSSTLRATNVVTFKICGGHASATYLFWKRQVNFSQCYMIHIIPVCIILYSLRYINGYKLASTSSFSKFKMPNSTAVSIQASGAIIIGRRLISPRPKGVFLTLHKFSSKSEKESVANLPWPEFGWSWKGEEEERQGEEGQHGSVQQSTGNDQNQKKRQGEDVCSCKD